MFVCFLVFGKYHLVGHRNGSNGSRLAVPGGLRCSFGGTGTGGPGPSQKHPANKAPPPPLPVPPVALVPQRGLLEGPHQVHIDLLQHTQLLRREPSPSRVRLACGSGAGAAWAKELHALELLGADVGPQQLPAAMQLLNLLQRRCSWCTAPRPATTSAPSRL